MVPLFPQRPWCRFRRGLCAVALPVLLCAASLPAAVDEPAETRRAREQMVRTQIQARQVTDPVTLRAMLAVPRHHFVPGYLTGSAYRDSPLPIGYGQTISQPYIVAYMTEMARPGPGRRVLEIGTGSGYQAAVLATTGAEVYSIEIIPQLAQSAQDRLARLGYGGVRVRAGDGYFGWPEKAPFDAILVTAAADFIPPPLIEQLKEGGRMLIPVGTPFLVQTLMLVEKRGGKTVTRSLMPVRFVPLRRGE
ncbi:MAG TPA: protein-L-isoaspartate(D-aspartate) O-methyltransferase [Geobacteraceae bacterium]